MLEKRRRSERNIVKVTKTTDITFLDISLTILKGLYFLKIFSMKIIGMILDSSWRVP